MEDSILVEDSLILEVYTFGFNGVGESSLILIKVDNYIEKSILIDFYDNSSKQIKNILDKNKVSKLNYIIWTHPHEDHTRGLLDIINMYGEDQTKIIYPAYLIALEWSEWNHHNKEQAKIINLIKDIQKEKKKHRRLNVKPVAASMFLDSCKYKYIERDFELNFTILSPDLSCVEKKFLLDDENLINDFSIACCIEINKKNFIFSGDIQNNSINNVERHLIPKSKGIQLLKIPHHGSKTSTDILKWIDTELKIGTSIVTSYSRSSLPKEKEIKKYENRSETMIIIDKSNDKFNYGMFFGKYDIINEIENISLEGNAFKSSDIYFENDIENLITKID